MLLHGFGLWTLDFERTIEQLRGGLVVSCQAPEGSPLDRPEIIAAFAAAAERAGAVGVRTNRPANIRAARAVVGIPIVGIYKQKRPGEDVYITRDFQVAEAVAEAGADIIALDATPRRPEGYDAVARLIGAIRGDLRMPVMADISSIEEAAAAAAAGADLVATTLFGYTAETRGRRLPALGLVRRLVRVLAIPVICEGGIASPEHVAAAFKAGAYAVVVGTALTGIEARVKQFAAATPRRPSGRQ
jgi:N-acylglucosamine-6-phosphate 2-epimerase